MEIRLRNYISDKPILSETYKRLYGQYKGKTRTVQGVTIFHIYGCRTNPPMCFSQKKCNYTENGRMEIHVQLKGSSINLIHYYLNRVHESRSTEFIDNSISLIAGQKGVCYVTGEPLDIGDMECHHKKPKHLGGMDEYKNLVWLKMSVHKLIHCTLLETIENYLGLLSLDKKGLIRINSLRKLVGNSII